MNDEEQAILEHFNNLFAIKVNNHIKNNMPLLKLIYESFEEILTKPNKMYSKLSHKDIQIVDKLSATLNKEQLILLEDHLETINKMCALEGKQLFFFGYILTTMLDKERKMSSD